MRWSFAAIALLTMGAGAQSPQPAAPQQPVFRSTTAVVEVTVIVRDKDGAFVRGLTIDDFEVSEDGAPQQIQTLYLVEGPPTAAAVAAGTPAVRAGVAPGPQALRSFVFFFDMEHLSPGGLTRAREAVETFATTRLLKTDLSGIAAMGAPSGRISGDHLATLAVAEGLKPRSEKLARERDLAQWPRILSPLEAQGIARNEARVLQEVRDRACLERNIDCVLQPEDPGGNTGVGGKQLVDQAEIERSVIESELRSKASAYVTESRAAAERAVGALTQLSAGLERIPGRKTIVWLTEGTWAEEVAERAREAAFRAAQSGVAVYTIDPRGLGRSNAGDMQAVAGADVGQAFLQDMDDIANVMATGSGGRAFRSENNLTRALDIIEDDTSTYYVLGYAPSDAGDRSKYRPLKVRVTREGPAGNDARVRHGFMAPQRVGESTAPVPAPEPAPVRATPLTPEPTPAPEPPAPDPVSPEPVIEPAEPAEPLSVRRDSSARVRELSGGADVSGRDLGSEGWKAYQRGDLETALPLLERAAAQPGAPAWVHYALGFSYVGMTQPADALSAWERVLAAAPEFEPVYLDLATTYAQVRNFDRALAVLRDAARRWPRDTEIHNGLGVVLIRRGSYDDAVRAFSEAVRIAPRDAIGWLNLGRAYELRYLRNRRYIKTLQSWIGPESDRLEAREAYERAAKLGGPYAEQAVDALARLQWTEK